LGGHNFLISNLFSMILGLLDAPRGGLQVCFWAPNAIEPCPGCYNLIQ